MHPVLVFVLGGQRLVITSYRAFTLLAAVAGLGLGWAIAVRRGLPPGRTAVVLLAMAAATPVGARLWYAAINLQTYIEEPARLFSLDLGGFSIAGGLLLALAVGFILCRRLSLPAPRLADAAAPALGVGIATMRVGCFLAGCCFGKPTTLPWGVAFPLGSNAHLYQVAENPLLALRGGPLSVHPTQLYELAAALLGAGLAACLLRWKAKEGTAFLTFILWYSAFRWANHYLRAQPTTLTVPEWFYPALYAVIILLCLWLLARRYPPAILRGDKTHP